VKYNPGLLKDPATQWLDKAIITTRDAELIDACKQLRSDFMKQ